MRVRNLNECLTGIFLVLVALLAWYLTWPLSSGTEVGLGPGYVPKMFGSIQLLFGVIMIAHSFTRDGTATQAWHLRPLVLILGSVTFFAMTIERMGFAVALIGLVLIGCSANRGTTLREAIALAVGTTVFSVLVFVTALGLPLRVMPTISWGN